jgi:dTMP kinase
VSPTARFIAFEGGEGTGKSTQARLLGDALAARGIAHVITREPGGTPGAEAIRRLLLDPAGPGWGAPAEALLFAAARSDHVERLIRPALERGQWIICDRFVDSSRAYQGVAGALGDEAVRMLHRIGSGDLLPDVTVLLKVDAGHANARLVARDAGSADRIGGRDAGYHAEVSQAFERFAQAEPDRFVTVNGEGSVEEVHARVLAALARWLP